MSTTLSHLDNTTGMTKVKKQLKIIKKEKINAVTILGSVADVLRVTYTLKKQTQCELTIKIDKKMNIDVLTDAVYSILSVNINNSNIDVDMLFRVKVIGNEMIVQTKRSNEE